MYPAPLLKKNDKQAKNIIWIISIIVFIAIACLSRFTLKLHYGFDVHVFALINAIINSTVALFLLLGLLFAKQKKFESHKKIMLAALVLSVLFLVSYICHHLFAGETKFGDLNHDGVLSLQEKELAGNARIIYYIVLATHIPMAAIILPFALFTAYRALIGEYEEHKKLVRITWPLWLYVAVTGVIVYIMISPYYN